MMRKKRIRLWIVITVPIAAVILFSLRDVWMGLAETFPPCRFYGLTGFHCPSCGNTRCVLALLRGDLLGALRNNAALVVLLALPLLLYLETALRLWKDRIQLLPRSVWFWSVLPILIFLYYILRNVVWFLAPV